MLLLLLFFFFFYFARLLIIICIKPLFARCALSYLFKLTFFCHLLSSHPFTHSISFLEVFFHEWLRHFKCICWEALENEMQAMKLDCAHHQFFFFVWIRVLLVPSDFFYLFCTYFIEFMPLDYGLETCLSL